MIVLALLGGLSIRLPRGLPFGRVAGTQFVSVVEEEVVLLGPRHFKEGTSFHVVFTVVVVAVASNLTSGRTADCESVQAMREAIVGGARAGVVSLPSSVVA